MTTSRAGCLFSAITGVALAIGTAGCASSPPPPRVAIPATSNRDNLRESDYIKPMPPMDERIDTRVNQRIRNADEPAAMPAPAQAGAADDSRVQADFVDAYHKVGRPQIVIYVNRTLEGELISEAPADRDAVVLHADQYDAVATMKAIEAASLQKHLAEQMSVGSEVTVAPADVVRQKLTDTDLRDLDAGHNQALAALDDRLNAQILIQVQAQPTKKDAHGVEIRLVAQAINVRGGEVIGHAVADVDRLDDTEQVDGATHYICKKLMIDMLRAWTAPQPGPNP